MKAVGVSGQLQMPRSSGVVQIEYFSMFSGIGGFELAIDKVFADARCVGYSEIDRESDEVYRRRFPGIHNFGDATRINAKSLPDFDLFVGGFPCQAFSVAGQRKGFDDPRGTLIFEVCRILGIKRPAYLLLENVKGLLDQDGGRSYLKIKTRLAQLGYVTERRTFNSKHYTGQNRERVFIFGYLPEKCFRTVFLDERRNPQVGQSMQRAPKKPFRCLCTGFPTRYLYGATIIHDGGRFRMLTPLEYERLQGFPDGWTDV